MIREDRKIKIEQNERAKKFERELLYGQIQERMEKLDDIKNEKVLLEEKRKLMEKELIDEKEGMENRLEKIMKHEEYLSRDEILEYVFNDRKPNLIKSKTPDTKRNKEQEIENKNKSRDNLGDYSKEKFVNINEINTDFNNSQEVHDDFNKKIDKNNNEDTKMDNNNNKEEVKIKKVRTNKDKNEINNDDNEIKKDEKDKEKEENEDESYEYEEIEETEEVEDNKNKNAEPNI